MNIAEWSIRNKVITWVLTLLMVAVGYTSFFNLSWLEDPEFTIKDAVIITPYPGASAAEVEEEVTNVIEKAAQQMGQLKYVESQSSRGMSIVQVTMKDKYDAASLPQVWDELRRKINDAQRHLPPGAGPSLVNDDFGDVYGVYVAITSEGYSYKETYEFAKYLQRELLHAKDVKRIVLYGEQPEAVFIQMRREKMAEFGVSPQDIYNALAAKNLVAPAGHITLGQEYIPANPTGEFISEEQKNLVFLRDIAEINRGYQEPAKNYLRFNKKPAIGLAISTVQGGNVVIMGESLYDQIQSVLPIAPIGMELNVISLQYDAVTESIKGFLVNLAEAVVIVFVVLLIFMGLTSGLIIGGVLLVTIMGTFIFMNMLNVTLERISLGALVIALGMLVDNAIVVTDGMRIKMQQGIEALTAAKTVVAQTGIPLLGATIIAILAFAAIGTSQDATGEYTRSLFTVILISLGLSWITAVTTTPLLCATFFKVKEVTPGEQQKDPYAGKFYQLYQQFLSLSIRYRWITVVVVMGLFLGAVAGFGNVKNSFFPDSTRPQFLVDFWFPVGTHIEKTTEQISHAEDILLKQDHVENVASFIGGSQVRFLLTYTPEKQYSNYAQTLITVDDYKVIPELIAKMQSELQQAFPGAVVNTKPFILGPSKGGKIQLRISGPDPVKLRTLANKARDIMEADPYAKGVYSEWFDMIKVLRPQMAEAQARRAGIDRPDLANAIGAAIEGVKVGVYRERDELLPVIARAPENERLDFNNLDNIQVWSPVAQQMIPAAQVASSFDIEFENPYIWRRDRSTMIRVHADVKEGLPSQMFNRIKANVEQALDVDAEQKTGESVSPEEWNANTIKVIDSDKIPLKGMPGYYVAWGGEAEDSARAQSSIAGYVPIFFGLMVLMVIILFNSIRKTLVIWLTVPMAIIGVTIGLLAFDQPFSFMALLGLMSLAGMLIKNAIVLIDQIDAELASGKQPFQAIIDSGVSRLIPVAMAAATTILGMVPLLTDAFFISMAVTIMFGLGFATLLTLVFVPVLYAIFFRVKNA